MTITTTPTVAAARPRTLSLQGAPLALPAAVGAWREEGPRVTVPTYRRTKSAFMSASTYHNSIRTTVVAATIAAVRDRVGTDKQAAPPRGVPR